MNIFHTVTLQSLRKNKTRTVVTIIGIMLSAAMICAVTTFVSSIYNYALETAIYRSGDWHGAALETEWETYEEVWTSGQVEDAVYAQQLGYALAEGCQNENKPYLYLLGTSEDFPEMLPVHLTAGRYPTAGDEILLPEHLYTNGGVRHVVGDVLTLELGDRMSEGYKLGQYNPLTWVLPDDPEAEAVVDEAIAVRETRTYTVVGFYERPNFESYSAPGYTALTVADKEWDGSARFDVYFKMKNAADVYDFMEELPIDGNSTRNTDVLTFSGVSRYTGFHVMMTGLAAIVIGLIMFGSISLIYNAFSISVSERTKQFGLLSSVGATKKQLRRMVFFEALTVSAVGIPLGILAGILGIGTTLLLIGHMFESLLGYPIPLRICVSPASILIAVLIALVTVLISAWIPSKRATRVSAVEAIRQNLDVNAKSKEVKTSKLMDKLFGLPGMLANKHYKRSRKKYRATIISLFMSIVLFVSASAFTDYLMESATGGFSTSNYDLRFWSSEGEFTDLSQDELLELLREDTGVTDAAYTKFFSTNGNIDRSDLSEQALQSIDSIAFAREQIPAWEDDSRAEIPVNLCFVNDSAYKELLRQYKLEEGVYLNPEEPLGIVLDGSVSFDHTQEKFVTMNFLKTEGCELTIPIEKEVEGYYYYSQLETEEGEWVCRYVQYDENDEEIYLDIPFEEAFELVNVKAGKTIYDAPFFTESYDGLTFFYPESLISSVLPEHSIPQTLRYYFTSNDHSASYAALKETLSWNGFDGGMLADYAEQVEENRNIVTIVQVFSYGFIVLISLIAAANVFNTISTNISLRRREFAMLKSVGMTARGFNRMMNFECLLYGSRALLYGLPVSIGVTYLIYRTVSVGYSTGFRLPWASIGIAVLSVFAVVFATMMYSMSKIKKDNPIDALKNENL